MMPRGGPLVGDGIRDSLTTPPSWPEPPSDAPAAPSRAHRRLFGHCRQKPGPTFAAPARAQR
eukprot:3625436-Lingulodinium_polyedra.AAC.1